jgi:coproporphyrinogen III oxidase-like Fe-S oxidoreductase
MGLRISEGIDPTRYAALSGAPLDSSAVTHLQEIGMVEYKGTHLCATHRGRAVLHAVIRDLLPD